MAAQITLPSGRAINQTGRLVVHRQPISLALSPTLRLAFKIVLIVIAAALLITFGKAYSDYREFAGFIDQQIAAGFLRSHAGFYAAPRIIERGARINQQQLITALQQAGYGRETSSNIWRDRKSVV